MPSGPYVVLRLGRLRLEEDRVQTAGPGRPEGTQQLRLRNVTRDWQTRGSTRSMGEPEDDGHGGEGPWAGPSSRALNCQPGLSTANTEHMTRMMAGAAWQCHGGLDSLNISERARCLDRN